ncbi:MAG TPA: dihydrodipicolinate synthase family protein [Candidatus Omnitrophota bacterium]|nr:dihydrodipicolinate synthase family protein [Candidatus Omnitrophota bacterium]
MIAPVITPFDRDLAPEPKRFVAFCRALVGLGLGLAPFGTTGEGNSLSVDERIGLMDALAQGGIPMAKVMPGTGCCALSDTVRLTAHAVKLGCAGALMLPPFYYKGVADEALYRSYSEVIQRVGDERLRVYLYHFPRHAQMPIGHRLVEALIKAYPDTIAGIKDSSGDWLHTEGLCKAFPDLDIFTGSDALLLKTLRAGGAGCIATNVNVNGAAMVELHNRWRDEDADLLQDAIAAFRLAMKDFPLIPAVKALVAIASGDATWRLTRPPQMDMPADQEAAMVKALAEAGFPVA